MITFDENGNIISDSGPDNTSSANHNTSANHTNPENNFHNTHQANTNQANELVDSNIICPEFEQARQITVKAFAKKGHPFIGAALAASTYGLEMLFASDKKFGNGLFNYGNGQGGKV